MKQGRGAGVLFTTASAVLAIICIILFVKEDRTAPRLVFQASDTVYREDMDRAGLLEKVTAYDNADGDVTGRIVIEKIIEDRGNNSAIVFYAVSDKAGNAAKSSKVFQAVYEDETHEQVEDKHTESFLTAGIDSEIKQIKSNTLWEEEPKPSITPEPIKTPSPTPQPTASPNPTPTATPMETPLLTPNPEIPVLTLKVLEVKVSVGQGPAWVDIIGTLSDDRDGYETLFKNLTVSKYDRNKAGRYQVSVYTEDSDGNRSAAVPLTIIVE